MQNMASRPRSLHDDLADQLGFLDCRPGGPRRWPSTSSTTWTRTAISTSTCSEVVRDFGGDVTMAQAEEALALVQKLDPPGVGARNLRECLLLQLTPDVPCRDILQVLIANHLDDLQQNRLPAIEKKTGHPDRRDQGGDRAPAPAQPAARARSTSPESTQYVVPDLIVEADEHGEYEVRLRRRAHAAAGDLAATTRSSSRTSRPTPPPASSSRSGSSRPAG